MCRLSAYFGAPICAADLVTKPNRSIVRQSFDARERMSGDAATPGTWPLLVVWERKAKGIAAGAVGAVVLFWSALDALLCWQLSVRVDSV